MIVMFFVNLLKSIFITAIEGVGVVTLPVNLVSSLATITGYGAYVLGGDLLLLVCATITFWVGFKLSVGLLVFIWKLFPFA